MQLKYVSAGGLDDPTIIVDMASTRPISCSESHVPRPSTAAAAGASPTGWLMPSSSDSDGIVLSRQSRELSRDIPRNQTCSNSFDELFAVGAMDDDERLASISDGTSPSTSLATACPSEGRTASMNITGKILEPLSKLDENVLSCGHSTYQARPRTYEEEGVTRISAIANACVKDFEQASIEHQAMTDSFSSRNLLPPLFNGKDDITTASCSGINLFESWNGFEGGVREASGAATRATLTGSAAPIFDDDDDFRSGSREPGVKKPSCEMNYHSMCVLASQRAQYMFNGLEVTLTSLSTCSVERQSASPILMPAELASGPPLIPTSSSRGIQDPPKDFRFPSAGQITRLSRDRANSTISAVAALESSLPQARRSKAAVALRRCSTTPLTLTRGNSKRGERELNVSFSNALLNWFHDLDRRGALPLLKASSTPKISTERPTAKASSSLVPSQRGRSNSVTSLPNLSSVFDYVGRSLARSLSPQPLTSTTSERRSPNRQRTWSFSSAVGAASSILGTAGTATLTPYRWEEVESLNARFCTSSESTNGLNSFLLGLQDMEQGGKPRTWDPRVGIHSPEPTCALLSSPSFSDLVQAEEANLKVSNRWPRVETTWGEPAQVIVGYVGGSQNVFSPRELTPTQVSS
ncbi:BQ2448_6544 [Microbotryum intermedium]|uniref:BQ2448_6544 protein n=1 Tax=Microbotryum intermedium TaxID=269621 RepID=A0A238FK01_9BASI|nr:BQ2448_6544 [Microbotryum intermedium]